MKYILPIFLSAFLLKPTTSLTQVFSFGLKGGPVLSNIQGDYSYVNEKRIAYNFGAFVNFNFTKIVGVVSELNYEQKGFKYNSGTKLLDDYTEGEKRFDYLTVPILFRYRFGKNIKFHLDIGTYLGILLFANDKGFYENYQTDPTTRTKWENEIFSKTNDIDVGLCFGTGFQYPINKKLSFLIEGRYNSGLLLIELDKIFDEECKNVSLNLNLGLIYHLFH